MMPNTTADVDAERSDHLLVVDAGTDDHAHSGPVEPQPQHDADDHGDAEHEQPARRVALAEDLGEVGDSPGHTIFFARPPYVGQHLVGEDDRHRDRDDRLAEILALVPAQEHLLDHHAQDGDRERSDQQGNHPLRASRRRSGSMFLVLPTIVCCRSMAM